MREQSTADFITPEQFVRERAMRMEATRGRFLLASCDSGS